MAATRGPKLKRGAKAKRKAVQSYRKKAMPKRVGRPKLPKRRGT